MDQFCFGHFFESVEFLGGNVHCFVHCSVTSLSQLGNYLEVLKVFHWEMRLKAGDADDCSEGFW